MPTTRTPSYDHLASSFGRLHHLEHLQSMAYWDQASMMPAGGAQARAGALAEVAALMHQLRTDPALGDALARAQDEPLDEHQRANLREIGREWRAANALPESLVSDLSRLLSSTDGEPPSILVLANSREDTLSITTTGRAMERAGLSASWRHDFPHGQAEIDYSEASDRAVVLVHRTVEQQSIAAAPTG